MYFGGILNFKLDLCYVRALAINYQTQKYHFNVSSDIVCIVHLRMNFF